jgi:hypothetical protein
MLEPVMDFNGAGMENMRAPIPKDGIPPKEFTDAVRAWIGEGIKYARDRAYIATI